jgi:hypothetical protein
LLLVDPRLLPKTNVEIRIPMGTIRLGDVLLLQCSRMNDGDQWSNSVGMPSTSSNHIIVTKFKKCPK